MGRRSWHRRRAPRAKDKPEEARPLTGRGQPLGFTARWPPWPRRVPRWHRWSKASIFLGHALTRGTLLVRHRLSAGILPTAVAARSSPCEMRVTAAATPPPAKAPPDSASDVRQFGAPRTFGINLTPWLTRIVARKHLMRLRSIGYPAALFAPLGAPCHSCPAAGHAFVRRRDTDCSLPADARHTAARYYRRATSRSLDRTRRLADAGATKAHGEDSR